MIKFKKLAVLFLSVAMCVSFAFAFIACSGENGSDSTLDDTDNSQTSDGGEQSQTGETEVTYVGKTYGVKVEDVKYYTYYSDGSKSEEWDSSVPDYDDFVEHMTELDLKLTFTDETGAYLNTGIDGTFTCSYILSDGVFVFTDCVGEYLSGDDAEQYMNLYLSFGWNGTTVTFKYCGDEDQSVGEKYYAEGEMYEISE